MFNFLKSFTLESTFNTVRQEFEEVGWRRFFPAIIYLICKKYSDYYRGENNCKIGANGERCVIRQCVSPRGIIFDVGARLGEWTEEVLKQYPSASLFVFEPTQFSYGEMTKKLFPKNVHCFNVAMGARCGEAEFHVFAPGAGINSFFSLDSIGSVTQQLEKVKIETVDHFCTEHRIDQIDLLKIDVEGYELEVLRGSLGLLNLKAIKNIQFEYGGNIAARIFLKDFFDILEPYGYVMYKITPGGLRLIKHYRPDLENFQTANYLATLK